MDRIHFATDQCHFAVNRVCFFTDGIDAIPNKLTNELKEVNVPAKRIHVLMNFVTVRWNLTESFSIFSSSWRVSRSRSRRSPNSGEMISLNRRGSPAFCQLGNVAWMSTTVPD